MYFKREKLKSMSRKEGKNKSRLSKKVGKKTTESRWRNTIVEWAKELKNLKREKRTLLK